MIQFSSVSKIFPGRIPALVDASVEIADGEFVFLIGPSGSGKTTFLRLLIRDLLPTEGSITVDKWELDHLSSSQVYMLRRHIGVVFQDFKLLSDRTVFENVAIVLEILGKSQRETIHGVGNVLELVGLDHKKHLFPQQLSAGEMQRTGIARAIVGGPKILLADEPTGNLDPETSWGILEILQEINKMGTTVVMASHNVAIVDKLKKRTIALLGGKVISDESKGHYRLAHRHKEAISKNREEQ